MATKTYWYWMLAGSRQLESIAKGAEYPHNHGRVLSIYSNRELSWVLQALIGSIEILSFPSPPLCVGPIVVSKGTDSHTNGPIY
jgi:hypothetical protein